MERKTDLPDIPNKFPHIFLRVAFDFLPEISYEDLVYLSKLARETGREKIYNALVHCLIKIQWAKFAGLEAIIIEKRIANQATEDVVPYDPIGQAQHAKALFDFVAHAKASLDLMAIFLNTLFNLGKTGGERDFRKGAFLDQVIKADKVIGKHIASLKTWFDKGRNGSDSIIAVRDEWLHRESPPITAMFPLTEIGYFPIPRILKGGFPSIDTPLDLKHYWTTPEFVDFHFKKLVKLFSTVVKRCIELEQSLASKSVHRDSVVPRISAFPMRGTRDTKLSQMRVKIYSPVFFDVNTLMEELPQKILKALTKKEADFFAKLVKYRTFAFHERENQFVLLTNDFIEGSLKITIEDINSLIQIGLLNNIQLALKKGATLISRYRGFMVSWPDDKTRLIQAISLTRLGRELATLVEPSSDEDYIQNVLSLLNSNRINVRLIAISDLSSSGFKYDDLGEYNY